jgi:hypothetical protein
VWPNRRCAAQFRGIASVESDDNTITMALNDHLINEADAEQLADKFNAPTPEELRMMDSAEFYLTQQAEKKKHRYC